MVAACGASGPGPGDAVACRQQAVILLDSDIHTGIPCGRAGTESDTAELESWSDYNPKFGSWHNQCSKDSQMGNQLAIHLAQPLHNLGKFRRC